MKNLILPSQALSAARLCQGEISHEYGPYAGADVELLDDRLRFKYTTIERITYQIIVMGMRK